MTETLVLVLLGGGMLGWGLMLDRLLGLGGATGERLSRALVMGFGILGWLAFFPALFQHLETPVLAAVPGAGLPGLWLLRGLAPSRPEWFTVWTWTLAALVAALAFGDVLEGLSPPADADSMAYHFATPKLFLKNGGMFFIPRASDGAAPLLPQMTYMLALGLGGERALTLWCMVTGWLLPLATYAYGRRHLDREWSLAVAATVMSLPTVLYGAGTGQVEARTAAFCLVAAFAASDAIAGRNLRAAVLAGMAVGFFMASKYTALFFVLVVGLVLLAGRGRSLSRTAVFAAAVLGAGGQWYGWHWWNTGDPVYPMLFGLLPYKAATVWTADQAAHMKVAFFGSESILPRTPWWWLAYPVLVLVDPNPVFEGGRVGLGPYPLLVAPFALAGLWQGRSRIVRSRLLPLAVIVLGFYSLWFFAGTSQRIRHYMPVVPIAVLLVTIAAERATRGRPARSALAAALAATLALQLGAQGLMTLNHAHRLVMRESRDQFLTRNIVSYPMVKVANERLGPGDRIMTLWRETIYLFDIPTFYAHQLVEPRLTFRDRHADVGRFWRELGDLGVTHVVMGPTAEPSIVGQQLAIDALEQLVAMGCINVEATVPAVSSLDSRALMRGSGRIIHWHIGRLRTDLCPRPPG